MDKKEKLDKLTSEKGYYYVDFLEKQKQNKKSFAQKIFSDFIREFDNSVFSVNQEDNKAEFFSIDNEFIIRLLTDIETNPKESLIFQISKTDNETKKRIEFLMRPNNISPLPKLNFNRLMENPYKGLDLMDIEILEQQKNIDSLKKYITDTFNCNDYSFYCENQNTGKLLGEFNSIKELTKQIR